ncbi:MAG TPA: OmpA family protein [Variovorax sp.]|nr:OmpA family protein [Variovorax sp.]
MIGRRPPFAGLALVVVLLAGCAAPATRVVLLPQEDGSPSAVVVRTKGGEQLVSQPYQRATAPVGSTEAPTLDKADPAEVRAENKALFELAPPKPQRFDLFFDVGGTVLTPESRSALDGVVSAALGRSGADITVTGHTDTQGSLQQNDGLALRRAEEIKQLLVSRGFPAARVEAVGRGERELAVPTADDADEPRNRRVVIVVR